MTTTKSTVYPKRIIEVDLPIGRISRHARDEKDSRCGHIPRMHIYPAARPLAACRAVVCAALWPDPADSNCPNIFRDVARSEMAKWSTLEHQRLLSAEGRTRFEAARKNGGRAKDDLELRGLLLDFIAEFSAWANSANPEFLKSARALTEAAHNGLAGSIGGRPLVVDPFAGGGAIPLESLRIGADVFASDSNPLSVLINKVVLQFAPRYGGRLADAVESWGASVSAVASETLSQYFPSDGVGETPIAYLWARTVLSEAPDVHAEPIEVPLIRSMWLSKKGELAALRWKRGKGGEVETERVVVTYSNGKTIRVRRPILEVFCPKSAGDVERGTAARSSATCPVTGYTTPARSVQKQLTERMGGASDARLYCVVSVRASRTGRIYSKPSDVQLRAIELARESYEKQKDNRVDGLTVFPQEHLPAMSGVFNAPLYGHSTWGSLFTARQLLALGTYVRLAREEIAKTKAEDREFASALGAVLGLVVDRLADLNASLCGWQLSTPNTAHVFTRWALPMMMDFGEVNPLAGAGGSPESAVWRIAAALRDVWQAIDHSGEVALCSAESHPLPDNSVDLFITDPPYYNAIPYADISDFFYVWLRRTIGGEFPELFDTDLSPKDVEICEMAGWDPVRYPHKNKDFFEKKMGEAALRARGYLKPSGIGVVVFAHKTTAGWEAILQALIDAGWKITASWPIDTEMASRMRAQNSAALASSVHLVCRPRELPDGQLVTDEIGDWRDVLQELPRRIHDWMPRLAAEGIVGADAIFACLGPALEVFSCYSRVEQASGEKVTLKEYLEHVWAAISKEALSMIFAGASTEGFEPDARLTAMWLWTLVAPASAGNGGTGGDEEEDQDAGSESNKGKSGGYVLEFDAARKIAQGLGAVLESLGNLIELSGDKARLLPVSERTPYLFGKEQADAPPAKKKKKLQLDMFVELTQGKDPESVWGEKAVSKPGQTTLDRIHQSMILFAAGRGEALKRFLVEDGAGRDQKFWRLAQALSALYPTTTDEKRWVDGVLARKKGLGL
jgi:putative DNA methylase